MEQNRHEQKKTSITPLTELMTRVYKEPPHEMIFSGIKKGSFGIVFGPSKSGKTMFCENLGMSLAAGAEMCFGYPLPGKEHKVLFISLEEHYRPRTERNMKQVKALIETYGKAWLANYMVVNENMPQYIFSKEDWQHLYSQIMEYQPDVVIIDSLTRFGTGSIEDSTEAKKLMKAIKELCEKTKTTMILIHHTHKLFGKPLSVDTIAGSRVIAQEAEFMFGINRTPDGKYYFKEVAFRYIQTNSDKVEKFIINDSCWLVPSGTADEMKLLNANDGRHDDKNQTAIFDYFLGTEEERIVETNELMEKFVNSGSMSKQTFYSNLGKLVSEKLVIKLRKGEYKLAA